MINVLSNIRLEASNLALQLVVALIRKEVDLAHSKRKWLDIGVKSYGNSS